MYFRPKTLEEAVQTLAVQRAQILSGGTDFFPALGERHVERPILDVSGVRELRGITSDPAFIRIGGLTTWSEIIATPLPRAFDALKLAAREIGGVQIQNRGTIAGNLCNASPAADGVPPLLALNAEVELVSAAGSRRVPLAQFIVGNRETLLRPDEVLSCVLVPRDIEDAASTFLKLGARRYLVISIAMVAVVLTADKAQRVSAARIAVGSCSARAQRLTELERDLIGTHLSGEIGALVTSTHLQALSPKSDVRATAEYRQDAARTLVARALDTCARNY
ncbi:MAG TPA: xanthine dehydrogenase family protein subunit M [Terriglobales bacterium]|nr:xanthine dehydrogenase family protein subunit M [Terriglobales bacterium]